MDLFGRWSSQMLPIHPMLDLNDLRDPAWQIIWVLVHNLLLQMGYCSQMAVHKLLSCSQTSVDMFLFINCSYLFYFYSFRWVLVHYLLLLIGSCSQTTLKDGFLFTNCFSRFRGIARVFGARGADFRLAPPPRCPPKKNCNSPKFAKSLKLFKKFGY